MLRHVIVIMLVPHIPGGVYIFSTTTAAGCDSTATLNLTINNSTSSTTDVTACDSYNWNGTTYTASGTYTFSTTNAIGCDSGTATLNLTINITLLPLLQMLQHVIVIPTVLHTLPVEHILF